jgi:hypothetical protein
VLCCTGATTAGYLSAGNKRIEFVALANLSCANGVLFESVFRAADPQKSFHTAKTLSRTRTALILVATLHAIALTPTAIRTQRLPSPNGSTRRLEAPGLMPSLA